MTRLVAIRAWFIPFVVILACFAVTKLFVGNYPYLLVLSLLFLPFLDVDWKLPKLSNETVVNKKYWMLLLIMIATLLLLYPSNSVFIAQTFFIIALPEEWFFRAYLLTRLGGDTRANIISSIAFSLLHAITRGPVVALEVFAPSLFYGWIFQKTKSLSLCIFAHAISNIFYVLVFERYIGDIRDLLK